MAGGLYLPAFHFCCGNASSIQCRIARLCHYLDCLRFCLKFPFGIHVFMHLETL